MTTSSGEVTTVKRTDGVSDGEFDEETMILIEMGLLTEEDI